MKLTPYAVPLGAVAFFLCTLINPPDAAADTRCRISLPLGGWTEGCPHIHESDLDNTPFDPSTWNPLDWVQSGAGEVCEANAAVTAERNQGRSQGLAPIQKFYLRPYFGSRVDNVRVVWNSLLNDEITFAGETLLLGSDGQTYGNTIYIAEQRQPTSTEQLTLLAHELKHVEQYQAQGGLDAFCTAYVAELWENGYELNEFEKEAYLFDYRFAHELSEKFDVFTTAFYEHNTPDWNQRSRIMLPIDLPSFLYVKNDCSYPVDLYVRYLNGFSDEWVTEGRWNFEGDESSYVTGDDGRLSAYNSVFYYYAEITQSPHTGYNWSGDENRTFGSRTLPMRETTLSTDSDDDYILSLICSNL